MKTQKNGGMDRKYKIGIPILRCTHLTDLCECAGLVAMRLPHLRAALRRLHESQLDRCGGRDGALGDRSVVLGGRVVRRRGVAVWPRAEGSPWV